MCYDMCYDIHRVKYRCELIQELCLLFMIPLTLIVTYEAMIVRVDIGVVTYEAMISQCWRSVVQVLVVRVDIGVVT